MSTDRHQVSDLSTSEVYKSFFENHPDAVYVLNQDGRFIGANSACMKLFGYLHNELLGKSFRQIVPAEQFADWLSSVFEQWAQGKPISFETTVVHKQGHFIEVHFTDTPILVDGKVAQIFGTAKVVSKEVSELSPHTTEHYKSLIKYNPDGICSCLLDGTVTEANPAYEQITGYSVGELRQIVLQDIAKHKRIRDELLNTQRLYERISENSQDVISYIYPDETFGYISPSVRLLLGYDPAELIGQPHTNLYHPDDIADVLQIGERCRSGEDVPRFTCRVRCKNGSYRWYETTLKFIRDGQGNLLQTVGVGRDISEQMRLQKSLEHAVTMANLGHWEWNMTTGHISYSPQAYRNLGIEDTNEVFTYRRFASFVHPDDVEVWERDLKTAIETGRSFSRTFRIVRTDGSVRFLNSQAEVVYDEAGAPVRMIGIAQDITERKSLEFKLKQSEERYRGLVENSLDAIGIFENRKCVFMNSVGLQMFGVTSDELIGLDYFDFLHPSHHDESNRRLKAILSGECLTPVEYQWFKKNGEVFHAEVLGSRFSEKAIQVCIRDMTERKQAYELLLRSEKLSAVGQLAAGVAHEIRNPLTALKGFTQMLREKSRGTNRRYFDIMNAELDRIELILNEMLVLAKPQVSNFKHQHVDLILYEVITFLSGQAMMRNVLLKTEFESDVPMVSCEEGQLKQVFINVIKNGIEAMPAGGDLFVRLKGDEEQLLIEFADEGEGIPEERIPKLGEPFFTTKENGTGLGLMMSHKIISAHKGTLSISSKVGWGTTVSVSLPVTPVI